jgi:hypothetical protein
MLQLIGDPTSTTAEACASTVARIHRPLLPQKPLITRSWIGTNDTRGGGFVLLAFATLSVLFSIGMLAIFVRDMRRAPPRPPEMDWSSSS